MRTLVYSCMWILLLACQSSTDVIYQPTQLVLTIIDDTGKNIKGAQVVLFNSEAELDAFRKRGDLAGQKPYLTDENGQVNFIDLDEKLNYFFYVTYRDRARFVDLENFNKAYAYPGFLVKGSKVTATIQLEKSENVIVFYSLVANKAQLPMTIFLDGDSLGSIKQVLTSPPSSPNSSGIVSYRVRQGVTKWYGLSKLGCLWTGELTVGPNDNFTLQELGLCKSGSVSFWTGDENKSILPIRISLSDGDLFGDLTATSSVPLECYDKGSLSGSRESGTYTYIAESQKGNCTWTGQFTLGEGECVKIKLEKCN